MNHGYFGECEGSGGTCPTCGGCEQPDPGCTHICTTCAGNTPCSGPFRPFHPCPCAEHLVGFTGREH
jgi:hypothetical protein